MENDELQKRDLFLKSVTDAHRILAGWKNQYGNKNNRFTEENDRMVFMITDVDDKKTVSKKKLHVISLRKQGTTPIRVTRNWPCQHWIKGSSFLVLNNDSCESISKEEDTGWKDPEPSYHYNLEAVAEEENDDSGHEDEEELASEGDEGTDAESEDEAYLGFYFLNKDILCSLQEKPAIPKSWVLYSQPILSNIRDAKRTLTLHCKGRPEGIWYSMFPPKWSCQHSVPLKCLKEIQGDLYNCE